MMDKLVSKLVSLSFLGDLTEAEEKAKEPVKTDLARVRTAVESLRADVARMERWEKRQGRAK
jgi:hypothetical protein